MAWVPPLMPLTPALQFGRKGVWKPPLFSVTVLTTTVRTCTQAESGHVQTQKAPRLQLPPYPHSLLRIECKDFGHSEHMFHPRVPPWGLQMLHDREVSGARQSGAEDFLQFVSYPLLENGF